MSGNNNYTLRLGDSAKVRPGIFKSHVSIIYAGMVSQDIYTIVVTWSSGNNSMAYNLFFTKGQREISTPKGRLRVEDVSAEEIRFSYYDD